jgi:hypothetical protein
MNPLRLWAVRRKRVYLLILLALPLVVWAACLWLRPGDADAALRTNFDCIQAGMSLDDAKGILGPPTFVTMVTGRAGEPKRVAATWEGEDTFARVYVDKTGAVTDKEYGEKPLRGKLRGWWRRAFGKAPPF